jgi:hypothetical protein
MLKYRNARYVERSSASGIESIIAGSVVEWCVRLARLIGLPSPGSSLFVHQSRPPCLLPPLQLLHLPPSSTSLVTIPFLLPPSTLPWGVVKKYVSAILASRIPIPIPRDMPLCGLTAIDPHTPSPPPWATPFPLTRYGTLLSLQPNL